MSTPSKVMRARLGREEAQHQLEHGGFAGAADGPTSATASPRRHVQRETVQRLEVGPRGIAEGDIVERAPRRWPGAAAPADAPARRWPAVRAAIPSAARVAPAARCRSPHISRQRADAAAHQHAIEDELHQLRRRSCGRAIMSCSADQRHGGQAGEGGEDRHRRQHGARLGAADGDSRRRVPPPRRSRGARNSPWVKACTVGTAFRVSVPRAAVSAMESWLWRRQLAHPAAEQQHGQHHHQHRAHHQQPPASGW